MMLKTTITTVLILALAVTAFPQQQETNGAGASLTSRGEDPVPGIPFPAALTGGIDIDIAGAPVSAFGLVAGDLAATSTPVTGSTEFFDLEMSGALLIVNGLGPGGLLPPVFGFLNIGGLSHWEIPVSPFQFGDHIAFQAVVRDLTNPPLNFSLTAAADFEVTFTVELRGDDEFIHYAFPSGAYPIYGQTYSEVAISTNGWLKFGGNVIDSDNFETTPKMRDGNLGGTRTGSGPIIAPLWDDIDMGNSPDQSVAITEVFPGQLRLAWNNSEFFPNAPCGTFVVTIDVASAPFPIVTFDYSLIVPHFPPLARGIVGLSAGGIGFPVNTEHDIFNFTGGGVNPLTPGNPTDGIWQNFNAGSPHAELLDLAGNVAVWTDITGSGGWSLN